eukprot:COSAG05_NODE_280_length_12288_cov_4.797933_2_plen_67_part_00
MHDACGDYTLTEHSYREIALAQSEERDRERERETEINMSAPLTYLHGPVAHYLLLATTGLSMSVCF